MCIEVSQGGLTCRSRSRAIISKSDAKVVVVVVASVRFSVALGEIRSVIMTSVGGCCRLSGDFLLSQPVAAVLGARFVLVFLVGHVRME